MTRKCCFFWLSLALAATLCGCTGKKAATVPEPGSPAYAEAVSAFFRGTIALQFKAKQQPEAHLTRATERAPGEPAAWANLALVQIENRQLDQAAQSLQRAHDLAPDDAGVAGIEGMLAQERGRFDEALRHFRRAAERDPKNPAFLAQVALEADRLQAADKETVRKEMFEKILALRPDNLKARAELLIAQAQAGDRIGMTRTLDALAAASGSWPADVRTRLQALKESTATVAPRQLLLLCRQLMNFLSPLGDYQASLRELGIDSYQFPALLIRQPRRLKTPSATPAAPDTGLTYAVEAPGASPAATVLAAALDEKETAVFSVDASGLRRLDKPAAVAVSNRPAALAAFDLDDEVGHLPNDDARHYRLDLAAAGPGGLRLLKAAGETFSDVTAAAKLPAAAGGGAYTNVWSVDIEADGDLDLVLSPAKGDPVLLQNNGDGSFTPLKTPFPGAPAPLRDFAWGDFDGDGDPDAALIDRDGALHVFDNRRSGLFKARPAPEGLSRAAALAVAETTGDTNLDLLLLGEDGSVAALADRGDGRWQPVKPLAKSGVASPARLLAADLDNNGGADLIVAGKDASEILLADEKGAFAAPPIAAPLSVRCAADLNGDGLLDLAGLAGGNAARALARGTKEYAWQEFTLRAKKPSQLSDKINAFAVGGEVEARAGLLYQKWPIGGPRVHLGLGANAQVDVYRIVWPNGNGQSEFGLPQGPVVADQHLGGSCPFLFAWDGQKMGFVTDCLWRSPLGLKINAQATAGVDQTEDWVKIRGDQLAAREGFYDLSITAELRETHYFDQVSLLTVDHPEGTDIFVDERFNPVAKPLLKAIPVKTPQPVKAARGVDGKDVTALIRESDGKYVDDFGRGPYQGVTRDHWIEIEIGDEAPRGKTLYLIAFGWLHPTDSSINVALSQNPSQAPPQGLSLETPDASGRWRAARPGLGFPEGKVKTIVLRIDDAFRPGAPRKLRLRTNLEVFWDQIRWAEAAPESVLKIRRLHPAQAELRYRGFSFVEAADESSPELPRSYEEIARTAPRWRDLEGFHTRFGDVLPLLGRVDDRYVIMNAGDEMALRFQASGAPPAGWKRDFVLIGDGWEKDGNVNTTHGQTVLPLPAHDRKEYPTPGRLEEDPVYRKHQADWKEYHTRYVTPYAFRYALR